MRDADRRFLNKFSIFYADIEHSDVDEAQIGIELTIIQGQRHLEICVYVKESQGLIITAGDIKTPPWRALAVSMCSYNQFNRPSAGKKL